MSHVLETMASSSICSCEFQWRKRIGLRLLQSINIQLINSMAWYFLSRMALIRPDVPTVESRDGKYGAFNMYEGYPEKSQLRMPLFFILHVRILS